MVRNRPRNGHVDDGGGYVIVPAHSARVLFRGGHVGSGDDDHHTEVSCIVKYLLFFFNIIFWLIGGGCIAIGLWAWSEKQVFDNLARVADMTFLDPALILIVIGGVMFFIGFCGCIGALRENRCLLLFYAVSLSIVLFLYVSTAVILFALKDWFKDQIRKDLVKAINLYREDDDLQSVIDWVQSDWLKCCGVDGPHDWEANIYFNCSSPGEEACGVPYSCCKDSILFQYGVASSSSDGQSFQQVSTTTTTPRPIRTTAAVSDSSPESDQSVLINYQCGNGILRSVDSISYIHPLGCIAAAEQWINNNMVPVAAVAVSIGVVQIFGICLAQTLRTDILAQISNYH